MPEQRLQRTREANEEADEHHVYLPADAGPFRCDHCTYYSRSMRCDNQVILARAKAGQGGLSRDMVTADGLVMVDAGGCSDEFEPREDFEGDHDEPIS
jgi:hypothetical protein